MTQTIGKIIKLSPFINLSRKERVDFLFFRDGEFAYQIHAEDTPESRREYIAMFRIAANNLENPNG